MKKRATLMTILMTTIALPLTTQKDYAGHNITAENNMKKTPVIEVGQLLNPREQLFLMHDSTTIDSIVNRPKINSELLVDEILDTISTYTTVVNKDFIKASIKQESWFDPKNVSSVGARGLLQIMPDTWKMFGKGHYDNAFNPEKNIRAGVKFNLYLEDFLSRRDSTWNTLSIPQKRAKIAAAYNGGHGRLQDEKYDITKMPKESRDHAEYIAKYMKEISNEREFTQAYYYISPQEALAARVDSLIKQGPFYKAMHQWDKTVDN